MSKFRVKIKRSAKKDVKKIKKSHLDDNFLDILKTLQSDPYEATHSFEKLKPAKDKMYSRRINKQHRVVYDVDEDNKVVNIYSAWSHYE